MYKNIKDLREDKDISQQVLASQLKCSQRLYSHYERGEVKIPPEILIELSNIYNVSVDYLLGLTDETKTYKRKQQKL